MQQHPDTMTPQHLPSGSVPREAREPHRCCGLRASSQAQGWFLCDRRPQASGLCSLLSLPPAPGVTLWDERVSSCAAALPWAPLCQACSVSSLPHPHGHQGQAPLSPGNPRASAAVLAPWCPGPVSLLSPPRAPIFCLALHILVLKSPLGACFLGIVFLIRIAAFIEHSLHAAYQVTLSPG